MRASDNSRNGRERRVSVSLVDRSAKFLGRLVFACILGLIVLTVIPYGMVDQWWEALFECVVFALTAVWILEVLFLGRWQAKRLLILVPMILLTAYGYGQAIELPGWLAVGNGPAGHRTLSIDSYQTFLTARKALALTLFLGLLLLHTSTPKRFRWLINVVIGLGLASALFGILRQSLQSPDSVTGFGLPYLFYGRGYGQFISPNVFAYLMEMVFGLIAGLVLGGGVRRNRVPIYLAIALFVWTALVLSNSRGALLALACQAVFLLFVSLSWYSERRSSRGDGTRQEAGAFFASPMVRVLFVVLLVAILIGGVLWMGGESLSRKITKEASSSKSAGSDGTSRTEIWRASLAIIKHHPWTGVGFGTFFLAVPEYQAGPGLLKIEEAHNEYLDLAANGGIVGVGLAGWFVALLIWRAKSSLRSGDAYRRAACLGAVAGILSVGAHSLADFGLQITGIGVVFGALVVISVADSRVESHSRRAEK